MAVGAASQGVAGFVETNAPQSAANIANIPQVVLDDPANGSVALHVGGKAGAAATSIAVVIAGAGTAGTAALDANATDLAGQVTLVTGSAAWGTGAQATITFGTPFSKTAYPVLMPGDATTAGLWGTVKPYVTNVAAGAGFSIAFQTADGAAHTFKINYAVLGN